MRYQVLLLIAAGAGSGLGYLAARGVARHEQAGMRAELAAAKERAQLSARRASAYQRLLLEPEDRRGLPRPQPIGVAEGRSGSANADHAPTQDGVDDGSKNHEADSEPDEKAKRDRAIARRLAELSDRLHLNDEQAKQIRSLLVRQAAAVPELAETGGWARMGEESRGEGMESILTPQQYTTYKELDQQALRRHAQDQRDRQLQALRATLNISSDQADRLGQALLSIYSDRQSVSHAEESLDRMKNEFARILTADQFRQWSHALDMRTAGMTAE